MIETNFNRFFKEQQIPRARGKNVGHVELPRFTTREEAPEITRYDDPAPRESKMILILKDIFEKSARVSLNQEMKRSENKALFPPNIEVNNMRDYIEHVLLNRGGIELNSIKKLSNENLDKLFDLVMIIASEWFESEQKHEAPMNLQEVWSAIEPDKLGNGFNLMKKAANNLFSENLGTNGYIQIDVGEKKPLIFRNDFFYKVVSPALKKV